MEGPGYLPAMHHLTPHDGLYAVVQARLRRKIAVGSVATRALAYRVCGAIKHIALVRVVTRDLVPLLQS